MPRRWKLSQDLPEKTLGGVILVKDSCSGEPGWNFTKKKDLQGAFYLGEFLKMDDFWQLFLNNFEQFLLTYFNFSP